MILSVLRHPTYAKLFSAQVIALLGTGLLTVALGLLAFDIAGTGAGAVLGTALTIKMVAYVGVAPVIAALIDRAPKKVVLVTADGIRLGIAACLPFVDQTWQIYVLVFVLQSASATFTPAFQSLIPGVLPDPEEYTRALSLSRLAYDLESLLSPLLAAALLLLLTYNNLFLGTAAGFALSAVLVLLARLPPQADQDNALTFWQRLPIGVRVFIRTPSLRYLMLLNLVVASATALVLVNSVIYSRSALGLGEVALAGTLASYGIGSLLIALNIPRLVNRFGVTNTMTCGAIVVTTGLTIAVAMTLFITTTGRSWPWLLATWALLGAGTSLISTPSARLLAEATTTEDRNLVFTAQFALSHACFLITYPIAGWLGATNLTLTVTLLLTLAALATGLAVRRHHQLDHNTPPAHQGTAHLDHV